MPLRELWELGDSVDGPFTHHSRLDGASYSAGERETALLSGLGQNEYTSTIIHYY